MTYKGTKEKLHSALQDLNKNLWRGQVERAWDAQNWGALVRLAWRRQPLPEYGMDRLYPSTSMEEAVLAHTDGVGEKMFGHIVSTWDDLREFAAADLPDDLPSGANINPFAAGKLPAIQGRFREQLEYADKLHSGDS